MNYIDDIRRGYEEAVINSSAAVYNTNLAYRPEFISNDHKQGRKVLSAIESELMTCDEFMISVAFITSGGIAALLGVLKELELKNIPGKVLTTDYQFFTEPRALKKLAGLKNIELRMYETGGHREGFHTKGYIFRQDEIYKIIIGSSNMTNDAITINAEWNTKIVSTSRGRMAKDILKEFGELWNSEYTKVYADFSERYEQEYTRRKLIRKQHELAMREQEANFQVYTLKPNKMQTAFVRSISSLMQENQKKALLISATGTGKTFASAFAMREMNPERMLFVVHREQIAKQARESYRRVFGNSRSYGLISGNSQEFGADITFATMQMMSKPEIHGKFAPDTFTAIVLDEVQHVTNSSYYKIMNYFKPKFWLGMTASPDTNYLNSDGQDVYSIFDHNIAYEIRLQQALEEDLLCPFHYYGITDIEIDGETINGDESGETFSKLVSDLRVDYVLEKAAYYGFSGERVRGLVFCSRKDEARELSAKFNERGLRSECLLGEDTQARREEVINRLTAEGTDGDYLDYIFTVDIFNEGVDIPEINQVIMLRPTQSPVVFVQQLGRGLRKFPEKEYVVILDFIGNYTKNNYMIPIALSGDRSYNKDAMRRYVHEGSRIIPGSSTVYFDEISRKRIYESIDKAKTNEIKLLKEAYLNLKYKLGRIPKIKDFKDFGSIDIRKFFNYKNTNKKKEFGSYHEFLKMYEDDYDIALSPEEEEIIRFFSKKLTATKRVHELALLKLLIEEDGSFDNYGEYMKNEFDQVITGKEVGSVVRNLTNEFPSGQEKEKYRHCVLLEESEGEGYVLSGSFRKMLEHVEFKEMILELIDYGITEDKENYTQTYKETNFVLYQKYSYEDVCRLLNWEKNLSSVINGYKLDEKTKTLPVFINYQKTADAVAYDDRFTSESSIIALSKHPRRIDSDDADHIYKRGEENKDNQIYLFVRKNKDDNEAKEFYFLGEVSAEGEPKPIRMTKTNDDAFEITYSLDVPVRDDIYDYITSE